jgi:hypothetical protein
MDTRNRSAFDIVADLRAMKRRPCLLAVLGSHAVDAGELAKALRVQWSDIARQVGFSPVRLLTGCADGGAEKAVRLAARGVTGELAVVFHRAEITYGRKAAEEMRDLLLAQEADALLLLAAGKRVCKHARERFGSRGKKVIEIEVG